MNDRSVGLAVRALRRRRGWRQTDLAAASGLGHTTVSVIESGALDEVMVRTLRQAVEALGARVYVEIYWKGAELDRLIDEQHAALVGHFVTLLEQNGCEVALEVSYGHYGERGSIDILARHPDARALLVVEVKSELSSIEETLRRLDQKTRLAPIVGRDRFGWESRSTSRLLVLAETSTARRRIAQHAAIFDAALPTRGRAVRAWLRRPVGGIAGVLFLSDAGSAGTHSGSVARSSARRPPRCGRRAGDRRPAGGSGA